jgi:hypothetical protein
MTSRVFIPQYPMHWRRDGRPPAPKVDLSPAEAYGLVTVLLPGRPELEPDKVMPLLHTGLRSFNSERDYFLCVGHPVLIAWAGVVLGHYTRHARFLDWDHTARTYTVVPLTITEGVTA